MRRRPTNIAAQWLLAVWLPLLAYVAWAGVGSPADGLHIVVEAFGSSNGTAPTIPNTCPRVGREHRGAEGEDVFRQGSGTEVLLASGNCPARYASHPVRGRI